MTTPTTLFSQELQHFVFVSLLVVGKEETTPTQVQVHVQSVKCVYLCLLFAEEKTNDGKRNKRKTLKPICFESPRKLLGDGMRFYYSVRYDAIVLSLYVRKSMIDVGCGLAGF